jgi:DNA-binding LytR/AlgR family response regulator
MKIAVCEDVGEERQLIKEYLLRYSQENLIDIQTEEFTEGEKLLSEFSSSSFKIIFMDIYLEGISGVETAYKIREADKDCSIIFITSSADHRADGFEVGALHYLVKPVTYEAFAEAMERCRHHFASEEKYFSITSERQVLRIKFKNVLYAEVYGKAVIIHTIDGIHKIYKPLSEMADLLQEGHFLQCHRCYLVNMQHISKVLKEDFQLSNGEKIPIRKNGRQKTKDVFNDYLFSSVRGDLE